MCSLLTEADIREAAECITYTFCKGEPMVLAMGITEADFYHFVSLLMKKAARDGMSVIARDACTHQLMGCIVCEDFVSGPPEGIEEVSPLLFPVFELIDTLGASYRAEHTVAPGEIYHLFMGGVYPEFAGHGIAARITHFIEENARKKGYKKAIGEVTGPISQHIYIQHLGYQPLYRIRYCDFLYQGKAVFHEISHCEECIMVCKNL